MVKRKTNRQRSTIPWSKEKQTRQRSTIQWSKEKQTDKGRKYNGLKKNKHTKVDNIMV
jgi:hypothetical protein